MSVCCVHFRQDSFIQDLKETAENEEGRFSEFCTHGIYRRQVIDECSGPSTRRSGGNG